MGLWRFGGRGGEWDWSLYILFKTISMPSEKLGGDLILIGIALEEGLSQNSFLATGSSFHHRTSGRFIKG